MASHLFEHEQLFCANPQCWLHVRLGDPGVTGSGNWAQIDGVLVGRGRYGGKMLCDRCGKLSMGTSTKLTSLRSQEA